MQKQVPVVIQDRRQPVQPTDAEVFLVDTMGEVPLFYAASDVAFVGGSLVPIGGHNLLEPAALGCRWSAGPHLFNAQDIADMFVKLAPAAWSANPAELRLGCGALLAIRHAATEHRRRRVARLCRESRRAGSELLEPA